MRTTQKTIYIDSLSARIGIRKLVHCAEGGVMSSGEFGYRYTTKGTRPKTENS